MKDLFSLRVPIGRHEQVYPEDQCDLRRSETCTAIDSGTQCASICLSRFRCDALSCPHRSPRVERYELESQCLILTIDGGINFRKAERPNLVSEWVPSTLRLRLSLCLHDPRSCTATKRSSFNRINRYRVGGISKGCYPKNGD